VAQTWHRPDTWSPQHQVSEASSENRSGERRKITRHWNHVMKLGARGPVGPRGTKAYISGRIPSADKNFLLSAICGIEPFTELAIDSYEMEGVWYVRGSRSAHGSTPTPASAGTCGPLKGGPQNVGATGWF